MIPVNSPRPLWDAKYGAHSEHADNPKTIDLSGGGTAHVHLPNPSLWPLLLSLAITVFAVGIIFAPAFGEMFGDPLLGYSVAIAGVVAIFGTFIGWLAQPAG